MRAGEGVVAVSVSICMGGTRGYGFVYTADDIPEKSVVCGVRGVCGLYEIYMCFARDGCEGELVK